MAVGVESPAEGVKEMLRKVVLWVLLLAGLTATALASGKEEGAHADYYAGGYYVYRYADGSHADRYTGGYFVYRFNYTGGYFVY